MIVMVLQIQELLQQVKAVPNRNVMREMCMSILEQPVAGTAADALQQALQQLQLEGTCSMCSSCLICCRGGKQC